jgi:hypothetical protein
MPQTLYHFSEDPTIETFRPHQAFGQEDKPPCVWAIDAEYAPLYWFPRDCPRITFWADDGTTEADKESFLSLGAAKRVHAIESLWLGRMRDCTLYAYHFGATSFKRYPEACGYHVAYTEVAPLRCEPVGDLLERHVEAFAAGGGGLEPPVQHEPLAKRPAARLARWAAVSRFSSAHPARQGCEIQNPWRGFWFLSYLTCSRAAGRAPRGTAA